HRRLAELLRRFLVIRIAVRVVLQRELAVGLLDLRVGGVLGHAEDAVVVTSQRQLLPYASVENHMFEPSEECTSARALTRHPAPGRRTVQRPRRTRLFPDSPCRSGRRRRARRGSRPTCRTRWRPPTCRAAPRPRSRRRWTLAP